MMNTLLKFWPAWLPIILFVAYIYFRRRKIKESGVTQSLKETIFADKVWFYTILVSLILSFISFIFLAGTQERDTDRKYVPARIKDGKIIHENPE